MAFMTVPAASHDEPDQAVLIGVAHGLREFYALPEHPCTVKGWLNSQPAETTHRGESAARRDDPSREMLHEA
jgi:hypothetical protein